MVQVVSVVMLCLRVPIASLSVRLQQPREAVHLKLMHLSLRGVVLLAELLGHMPNSSSSSSLLHLLQLKLHLPLRLLPLPLLLLELVQPMLQLPLLPLLAAMIHRLLVKHMLLPCVLLVLGYVPLLLLHHCPRLMFSHHLLAVASTRQWLTPWRPSG